MHHLNLVHSTEGPAGNFPREKKKKLKKKEFKNQLMNQKKPQQLFRTEGFYSEDLRDTGFRTGPK